MFDITPNDIRQLNDVDLRELVGRLCEAELVSRGLSSSAVTWGGNQTAADGGLDVRVELPLGTAIDGFVPRAFTGFQVKTPDMQRAAILAEMRPDGAIRPVIQKLASDEGAYVIVSSRSSTTDAVLGNRRNALREGLNDVAKADQLHTDFYDRTRLATWVRQHPGLINWVRERVGRALVGWRPYGQWTGVAESVDAQYLIDDKLRLHLSKKRDTPAQPIVQAIDELRDELAKPGKMVRLVGLSGVGKTRLAQALFDARIGTRPLPPSIAVYTNLSDNPDPQPIGLASDLLANRTRAILVIDNCPPDLHRRLSELWSGAVSTVSVLTIEYDVRDDQPEGTQVITLDASSPELIEKLIRFRYPELSQVDAHTIADASGGNARIAIALAETVEHSETIAGLSNDELFQRLFRQRQDPDNALLLAAQACSLVYSFQGDALTGEDAEVLRLAALAGQTPAETYRHVGELLRRDLVQQRGVWRAVLPHAIANRLAARALEDIPYELINQQLVQGGTNRLAQSFSRRLSFLHDHAKAVDIVKGWLSPEGLLGDVTSLNELGKVMFKNVAPVLPEAALAALERVVSDPSDAATPWGQHLSMLRSLAYDPLLFERSTKLLVRVATRSTNEKEAKEASDILASLFTIYLSGTHATIEQRLGITERLLRSSDSNVRSLGLATLARVLKIGHFSSNNRFQFGARSRDYGYQPRTDIELAQWYDAAFVLIERLGLGERLLTHELRDALAKAFRNLWMVPCVRDKLEGMFRKFSYDGFWREGWVACRETMYWNRDRLTLEESSRLSTLEALLRPENLLDRARAVLLGNSSRGFDLEDGDINGGVISAFERRQEIGRRLGLAVATDDEVFAAVLPDICLGGGESGWAFGRGLASGSHDRRITWKKLVDGFALVTSEKRDVQVLRGFVAELWEQDNDLAQSLLDSLLEQPALMAFLPLFHSATKIDGRGIERLRQGLRSAQVPMEMYKSLAYGSTLDHLAGGVFKDLLLLIANHSNDGFDVALEILNMRLFTDQSAQRMHEQEILQSGRELLQRVTLPTRVKGGDYRLTTMVKACLNGPEAGPVAAEVAARLRDAVEAHETYYFENGDLLKTLFEVQPLPVLDALFSAKEEDDQMRIGNFEYLDVQGNPVDVISSDVLAAWCDGDSERRYPIAASIVTFASRSEQGGPYAWSEQAKALLSNAPDPKRVLAVFIERFRPMTWSGSRAVIMEANAQLLQSVEPHVSLDLKQYVAEVRAEIAQEIAYERQQETKRDGARDERFE